jgi:cytochrome c553
MAFLRTLTPHVVASAAAVIAMFGVGAQAQNARPPHDPLPYWAYVVNPPPAAASEAPAAGDTPLHVPGSDAAFTRAQVKDMYAPPDWHASGHPAMPEIVGRGRAPQVFACGYCHLPNGQGRPENASLAGLPAAYITQQLTDFKNGLRKSSEPKHGPTSAMVQIGSAANEKEAQAAAAYFSGLKPTPWIRVVETDTVPKTHVAGWMLVANDPVEMEPIGQRIIETPENLERTELRDDHSGFIAYLPKGSIQKGEALANGSGRMLRCSTCHGRDLKGKGKTPALAGRSPSYIVRQLCDIQSGARTGPDVHRMKPVVAKLTVDDMLALAAYVASLQP